MYNIYYFIDKFDRSEISTLDKKVSIIYRNYKEKNLDKILSELSDYCKSNNRELFLSNNLKFALKYNLNGLYIPSFETNLNYKNKNLKKNFKIIGSAHNYKEIRIKEKQGCKEIFISPIFFNSKNKYFLDIIKFKNLELITKVNTIALGGINEKNYKKLKCTKSVGFASISWIKKTGLIKFRPV